MTHTTSTTLLEFAWNSLTDHQQYRIMVKWELKKALENNTGTKRNVYRAIADKWGYTMERIEYLANHELKK